MSVDAAAVARHRAYPHRRGRAAGGVAWRVAGVMFGSLSISAVALLLAPADIRALVAPLLANVNLALFFFVVLLFQDRHVPVFESGSLWVAATLIYASFPFLGFMAAGMKWTPEMDGRLAQYPFVSAEIVGFAWQYTMYLAAFVFTYLIVRRRAPVPVRVFETVRGHTAAALVIVFIALLAVRWGMKLVYGVSLETTYKSAAIMESIARIQQIPQLIWQIAGHLMQAMLLGQMGVAILLLTQWRTRAWARVVLVLWLLSEVAFVALRQSARAPAVMLLLCVILLYHRLVRPLSLKVVAVGGAAFLSGFLLLGIARLQSTSLSFSPRSALITANEFQALFATAFDLYQRKNLGILGPVPWQVYAVDLYLEIPSQLLPFEKIDPAHWYLDVIGARRHGIGYMFGVMAQAVVGLGWIELVLRGALLGVIFGLLHRWYVKRALRLWPTMLYVFLSIWSFITFRATTFWAVHFLVYQFLPFFLMTTLIEAALERGRRWRARRPVAAGEAT